REHLVAAVDERLEQILGPRAPGDAAQVGERVVAIVLQAQLAHVVVERDPDHPARHRGGAAEVGALLEHEDGRARDRAPERGSQRGAAGADDDDVVVVAQLARPDATHDASCTPAAMARIASSSIGALRVVSSTFIASLTADTSSGDASTP